MDGKELWSFLDAIEQLREKGNTAEKSLASHDYTMDGKNKIELEAKIYKEVAERLEKLLKNLTHHEKKVEFFK